MKPERVRRNNKARRLGTRLSAALCPLPSFYYMARALEASRRRAGKLSSSRQQKVVVLLVLLLLLLLLEAARSPERASQFGEVVEVLHQASSSTRPPARQQQVLGAKVALLSFSRT